LRRSSRREPELAGSRSFPASPWHRASSSPARNAAAVGECKHHEETRTFRFPCSGGASILVAINFREAVCITNQSTRTHNSRTRLRRTCWWSGHFYVRPHMPELNIITAVPVGALVAAIWAALGIRRLLRRSRFTLLSPKQRLLVWGAAVVAFFPALFVAFVGSMFMSNLTVRPGSWNHLVLALTVTFGLGIFGAAITWAVAAAAASLIPKNREAI
jgi:hypothetical protein